MRSDESNRNDKAWLRASTGSAGAPPAPNAQTLHASKHVQKLAWPSVRFSRTACMYLMLYSEIQSENRFKKEDDIGIGRDTDRMPDYQTGFRACRARF